MVLSENQFEFERGSSEAKGGNSRVF